MNWHKRWQHAEQTNGATQGHHVVIVDDYPEITTAMSQLLEARGYRVTAFHSAEALLAFGTPAGAACILLDISLPGGMDGLTLLEALRQAGCVTPVVVVSGAGDIRTAVRALKTGAVDFIEKPYAPRELLAAVASSISGGTNANTGEALQIEQYQLTQRELDVLLNILRGYSSKQMAHEMRISVRTVEVHRANLMRKIGARNVADLIRKTTRMAVPGLDRPEPLSAPEGRTE